MRISTNAKLVGELKELSTHAPDGIQQKYPKINVVDLGATSSSTSNGTSNQRLGGSHLTAIGEPRDISISHGKRTVPVTQSNGKMPPIGGETSALQHNKCNKQTQQVELPSIVHRPEPCMAKTIGELRQKMDKNKNNLS